MADKLAVLQDVNKCNRCGGCAVSCQENWPRHQNSIGPVGTTDSAGMLVASGTADKIAADDPTVPKAQRLSDGAPFVKYNCWHCPSPPCLAACLATGRGAITQNPDGSVHVEQHRNPNAPQGPWDKQWCNPSDPKCKDLAGRLVCVTACGRGGYPRRGRGDGFNDKIYKCTLCGTNAQGNSGRRPGVPDKWIGPAGLGDTADYLAYGSPDMPACVVSCTTGSLAFGTRENIKTYIGQILPGAGVPKFPFRAGISEPMDAGLLGSWVWVSTDIRFGGVGAFGHPTGDPYVEDHAIPMLEMLLGSPAGKMVLVPTMVAGGLYALYERKKARARAEATING